MVALTVTIIKSIKLLYALNIRPGFSCDSCVCFFRMICDNTGLTKRIESTAAKES